MNNDCLFLSNSGIFVVIIVDYIFQEPPSRLRAATPVFVRMDGRTNSIWDKISINVYLRFFVILVVDSIFQNMLQYTRQLHLCM